MRWSNLKKVIFIKFDELTFITSTGPIIVKSPRNVKTKGYSKSMLPLINKEDYGIHLYGLTSIKFNQTVSRSYSTSKLISEVHRKWVSGFTDAFKFLWIKQFSTKRNTTNNQNNLSLVIWGTNLTSLVGIGRITKQESNMIKFPYSQKGVIIGLLLSDGWLIFASKTNKNARLGFKQSLNRASYVLFVFNLLSSGAPSVVYDARGHYCSSSPSITTGTRAGNRLAA